MTFLFRAVFWTIVVAIVAPGAPHVTGDAPELAMLQSWKIDAIKRLGRVRAELHAQHWRGR
jgi:hypothetical protein